MASSSKPSLLLHLLLVQRCLVHWNPGVHTALSSCFHRLQDEMFDQSFESILSEKLLISAIRIYMRQPCLQVGEIELSAMTDLNFEVV
ncbi:hypothetical protein SDJN03_08228, partial [Cucurbita argyrosperma subsp. sororia]